MTDTPATRPRSSRHLGHDRRGGGPRPAGQGARWSPRDGRGRRADDPLHGHVADHPRAAAGPDRQRGVGAGRCSSLRLVQRSTVQFVVNALVGIGIGWLFVTLSARSGGSEDDQALAYFLPGILYNSGLHRAAGVHLPDRLAAGRLHGRQRHRRPDRLARRPPGREAVHPADLAAGPPVPAPGRRAGADLAGRPLRLDRRRHRRGRARRPQDRPRLAAPARRPRRDALGARPRPHPAGAAPPDV